MLTLDRDCLRFRARLAVEHGASNARDGHRSIRDDLAGDFEALVHELPGRYDMVQQAQLQCLVCADQVSGQQ
jgi:hypothetical protein